MINTGGIQVVKLLDNFGIQATKGDTIIMPFVVTNNDGSIYQVQSGDVINFGMKKNYEDAECIVEKTIDNNIQEKTLLSSIKEISLFSFSELFAKCYIQESQYQQFCIKPK